MKLLQRSVLGAQGTRIKTLQMVQTSDGDLECLFKNYDMHTAIGKQWRA